MNIHKRKAYIGILIAILSKESFMSKFGYYINLLADTRNLKKDNGYNNYYPMKDECFDNRLVLPTLYLKSRYLYTESNN